MADEARRVEVYQRYREQTDMQYPIGSFLRSLLHDAFGVLSLQGFYDQMDPGDLRVREGFETLGILQHASYIDSATEAGERDAADSIDEFDEDDLIGRFRASLAGIDKIEPEPVLQVLTSMVDEAALRDVEPATYRLRVDGAESDDWMVTIGRDSVDYRPGTGSEHRDLELTMNVETWTDLVAGRVTAPAAALDGRIGVEGDITKAEALIVLL